MASYCGNVLLDVDTMVARAVAAQLAAESHSDTGGRLKISQEEIASLCGVSRQRCNAALTRLARAGGVAAVSAVAPRRRIHPARRETRRSMRIPHPLGRP